MKKKKERKIEFEPKEFISTTSSSSDVIRYRLRYFIVPTVITLLETERRYWNNES